MIPVIHFQCRFMGFFHLVYLSDRQTTTSGYGTCANLREIDFIFVLLSLWDKLAKMSYKKWLRIEVSLEKVQCYLFTHANLIIQSMQRHSYTESAVHTLIFYLISGNNQETAFISSSSIETFLPTTEQKTPTDTTLCHSRLLLKVNHVT